MCKFLKLNKGVLSMYGISLHLFLQKSFFTFWLVLHVTSIGKGLLQVVWMIGGGTRGFGQL